MQIKEIKKLYYSIGDVSKMTDLKQYVLRYWETEFSILKPSKNNAGNRTYKDEDIKIIRYIKELLYEKKYTIRGAKQFLKDNFKENSKSSNIIQLPATGIDKEFLLDFKSKLEETISLIDSLKK